MKYWIPSGISIFIIFQFVLTMKSIFEYKVSIFGVTKTVLSCMWALHTHFACDLASWRYEHLDIVDFSLSYVIKTNYFMHKIFAKFISMHCDTWHKLLVSLWCGRPCIHIAHDYKKPNFIELVHAIIFRVIVRDWVI